MTQAKIIADSVNPIGSRLTTFVVTFPRRISLELMTHRVFSRGGASSRAIPLSKTTEQVDDDPLYPKRWGKAGPGMQDHGPLPDDVVEKLNRSWQRASAKCIEEASYQESLGAHKQNPNRMLEPFLPATYIVTSSEWDNFFRLRVHPAADPEFQRLAYLMLKAFIASTPRSIAWGEWHVPYDPAGHESRCDCGGYCTCAWTWPIADRLIYATAQCARVSYTKHEAPLTLAKAREIYAKLMPSDPTAPMHAGPFEHCAVATPPCPPYGYGTREDSADSGNFHASWKQYRSLAEATREPLPPFDPVKHLEWYESIQQGIVD